jgi:hypothetical protein
MTHNADSRQEMHAVPEGASAVVETTEDVRVTTPDSICGMGHRMKRKEDPRFIQGQGRYVDDIKLPGMLYMDIVRSPYAHAKILNIDASEALATPGVLAVITGKDLQAAGDLHWMPTLMSDTQMVLPIDKVVYFAQEVCAVVATERYIAADAVEKVFVDYEPLDPVVDPFDALNDRVIVRDDKEEKTNHIWHWEAGDQAATDQAFAEAATVVKESMHIAAVHDHPGASRHSHRIRPGQRAARAQDPGDLSGHRRRLRRQGAGVSGVRGVRRGEPGHGQAREVDRGPFREPAGGQLRPGLPHHRRDGGGRRREDHRLEGEDPGR